MHLLLCSEYGAFVSKLGSLLLYKFFYNFTHFPVNFHLTVK